MLGFPKDMESFDLGGALDFTLRRWRIKIQPKLEDVRLAQSMHGLASRHLLDIGCGETADHHRNGGRFGNV